MEQTTEVQLNFNLKGHDKPITGLKYHPQSTDLITSSKDHSVIIWTSRSTGIRSYKFSCHNGPVTDVDYAPNGRHFVTSSNDRTICLWEPSLGGKCLEVGRHEKAVRSVHYSYDNHKLLSGSNDKCLKIWDLPSTRFVHSLVGHQHWINCAKWSYDAKMVVSCCEDKTIKFWDPLTQQCIHTLKCSSVTNKISLFGNYVACALQSGSVRIFDIPNRKMVQHYKFETFQRDIAWHPSGKFLLAAGGDGFVRLLDTIEGHPLSIIEVSPHQKPVECVAISEDGKQFACTGDADNMLCFTIDL